MPSKEHTHFLTIEYVMHVAGTCDAAMQASAVSSEPIISFLPFASMCQRIHPPTRQGLVPHTVSGQWPHDEHYGQPCLVRRGIAAETAQRPDMPRILHQNLIRSGIFDQHNMDSLWDCKVLAGARYT